MTTTAVRPDAAGTSSDQPQGTVRSLVSARLDRLPWTRFHWLVVTGLGVSWILDGLEIQIVALVGAVLIKQGTLHLTAGDVGFLRLGVSARGGDRGAGLRPDHRSRSGERRCSWFALGVYLCFSGLGAFSFNLWFVARLPLHRRSRYRRRVHGDQLGDRRADPVALSRARRYRRQRHLLARRDDRAAASILLLNPALLPVNIGWRLGFFIGPLLGLGIIFLRRTIPESPRWLMTHGREQEAEQIVDEIEARVEREGVHLEPVSDDKAIELTGRRHRLVRADRKDDVP